MRVTVAGASPGFCTSTQVSKVPSALVPVEPSARNQVSKALVTPMESWAAWRFTAAVLQYIARSAITGWSAVTRVDTSKVWTVCETSKDSLLPGCMVWVGPDTGPVSVW